MNYFFVLREFCQRQNLTYKCAQVMLLYQQHTNRQTDRHEDRQTAEKIQCIQSFLTSIHFHNDHVHQQVLILQSGMSPLSSTTTGVHITELGSSCLRERQATCFGQNPACMKCVVIN